MWLYNGQVVTDLPEGMIAFVYLIENLTNGKRYIGKKSCYSTSRKPPLKGQKRRRVVTTESDWRDYTGSSDALNADIAAGHSIRKTILHFAASKGAASYLELQEQMNRKVLFDESYYNRFIGVKIHASHLRGLPL